MRRLRRCVEVSIAALLIAVSLPAAAAAASRYVVEFRARDGGVFGHTYVAYGLTDRDGRLRRPHYAGFYPSGVLSQTALLAILVTPAKVGSEPGTRRSARRWSTGARSARAITRVSSATWTICVGSGRSGI
jgi:hypothetical protein